MLRAEFPGNNRAAAAGAPTALLKVMAVTVRPVGATVVGTDAGEPIATRSRVLLARLTLSELAGAELPCPTQSEISKRAAGAYFIPRLFNNDNAKRVVPLVRRLRPRRET